MLRLEAFIEGLIYIYNTNKQAIPTQGVPVTCLENKNLTKNLNSLTYQLSTIYISTYLG